MSNDKKDALAQLIYTLLTAVIVWDVLFNKNIFNTNHLILSIFLIIIVSNKFKLDNFKIKIPGLIEIAESNKEINKNIEKIVNKIQVDASANANAKADSKVELNATSVVIKMPDGKKIDLEKLKDSKTSLG